MAERKQVMDIHANSSGITQAESNEQQRNWNDKVWDLKASDSLSNYDPTRKHLNFEVVKGGTIQQIDTSKSIAQKMAESLASRGIKDPNDRPNVRRRQNTLAQFVFGGSRERMLNLAFGSQEVSLEKGANNSHLCRTKDIESWAKDVYDFVAKRFGEDNIVGFYVHLDETNPHIHCSVIPMDNERGRISWRAVFGKDKYQMAAIFRKLHDDLEKEVGQKWGLERGNDIATTKARHRSISEYRHDLISEVTRLQTTKEDLLKQIHRAEIKLKGISTMIANLHTRKDEVQEQIDLIARQFGQSGVDNADLAAQMSKLRKELESIDAKLVLRQKMLDDANATITEAKHRLAEMKYEHSRMQEVLGEDRDLHSIQLQRNMLATFNSMLVSSLEPLTSTFTDRQQEILNESGYSDLMRNSNSIINCAMLLSLGYIREATTYAESCGGGGSSGYGWGRDKDEDEEHWWRRCIAVSAAMMRPAKYRMRRGR